MSLNSLQARLRRAAGPLRRIGARLLVSLIRRLPDRDVVTFRNMLTLVRELDYEKAEVLLRVDSPVELEVRRRSASKEPETVEWIERQFREGDVIYDVGANVGTYSLIACRHLRSRCRIYAFEPAFESFAALCRNILLNRCETSIIPLQVALSDVTRIDWLNLASVESGAALHALGEAIDWAGERFTPAARIPVLAFSLDDLVERFELPVMNHLKLDVDGTEDAILRGAARTLRRREVRTIMVEVEAGEQGSRVRGLLEEFGFELRKETPYKWAGPSSPLAALGNWLFVRPPA